jgi:hypothetical protein
MCRRRTDSSPAHSCTCGNAERARLIAAGLTAIVLATTLGGCSDFYFDRRDTIALGAGDAIAANEAQQIIDPWPAHSGNTNIAANGQRMQAAVERYRYDRVTPPVDAMAAQAAVVSQSGSQSQTATAGSAPTAATTPTLVISSPSPAATASQ